MDGADEVEDGQRPGDEEQQAELPIEARLLVEKESGVAPPRKIPYALAELAGKWQRIRARLTGRMPELTDEEVRIYKREWAYSSDRAIADLGYRITPLEQGVARMVAWLKSLEAGRVSA